MIRQLYTARQRRAFRRRLGLPPRSRRHRSKRHLARDVLQGAAAGAVATWLMGRVTTFLYDRENWEAREREDRARDGRTSYEMAAMKVARTFGRSLDAREQAALGNALHWTLGIGAGAMYGALGHEGRDLSLRRGLKFGTGFWLFMDETVTPALGLTPGPRAFPWQAHARGLVGHAAYGIAVEAAFRALRRLGRRA
ncbi:MAG TPA: DUF1440 domain-containing protein [Gemmatimonadaceae bacterium]|nr:DUF1440 domain-containing protein [Gemmatimonadaceae bacterium]